MKGPARVSAAAAMAGTRPSPHTAAAAALLKPPWKTVSAGSRLRSASSSNCQLQAMVSCIECWRVSCPRAAAHARCGQFDGQRNAFEQAHRFRHCGGVLAVQRKAGAAVAAMVGATELAAGAAGEGWAWADATGVARASSLLAVAIDRAAVQRAVVSSERLNTAAPWLRAKASVQTAPVRPRSCG
jgi:hypothetical protein